VLGGGLLAGVVAVLRLGPDRGKTVAEGAAAAVEALHQSLERQAVDLANCRSECRAYRKRALHAERMAAQQRLIADSFRARYGELSGEDSESC